LSYAVYPFPANEVARSYLSAASIPPDLDGPLREVSKDLNLTALVQLGALRLDTDRAFLSLLDGRNQYIVTEATRNHSLLKADESVFLGVSKLDITFGVCPKYVNRRSAGLMKIMITDKPQGQ
jgi:hypothetical protein